MFWPLQLNLKFRKSRRTPKFPFRECESHPHTPLKVGLRHTVAKLSAIVKICKYRGLHEGHNFILMAMEVHGTSRCDMDHSIGECAHVFHYRWLKGHISLLFYIQFFRQCVNIVLQCALAYVIMRNIVLAKDVCFKPPITIRFQDLQCCYKGCGWNSFLPWEGLVLSLFWFL